MERSDGKGRGKLRELMKENVEVRRGRGGTVEYRKDCRDGGMVKQ